MGQRRSEEVSVLERSIFMPVFQSWQCVWLLKMELLGLCLQCTTHTHTHTHSYTKAAVHTHIKGNPSLVEKKSHHRKTSLSKTNDSSKCTMLNFPVNNRVPVSASIVLPQPNQMTKKHIRVTHGLASFQIDKNKSEEEMGNSDLGLSQVFRYIPWLEGLMCVLH